MGYWFIAGKRSHMKKILSIIILAIILILTLVLPGCARVGSSMNGSGKIVTQDLKVKEFTGINAHGPFELEISQAESFKVTLSTDENLVSRVLVSLDRKTLKLSIEAPASFFPTVLKLKIEMPQIRSLNLSGHAGVSLSGFKSNEDFTLFAAGDSTLIGSLEATIIRFNLSEASRVSLSGAAVRLELECKGGSRLDLENLALTSAQVKLTEQSEAILDIEGRFDVILNDNSKIYYLGNPLFSNTSITGDSTMIHK
jgi:hypothetical protein